MNQDAGSIFWRSMEGYKSFFFFQAEDGIRDVAVTGVQTCALPIWSRAPAHASVTRIGHDGSAGGKPMSTTTILPHHSRASRWPRRGPPKVTDSAARTGQIGRASCRERCSYSGGNAQLATKQ